MHNDGFAQLVIEAAMPSGPREIVTPYRPIPLAVPEGMKPNEFFNSAENLADLMHNNGLLHNPEGLLLYRKALGHSNLFDCSIIYNTSQRILDPLGRPVRRTQVPEAVRNVWNRMNQILIAFMLECYPDHETHLVLAGEASLDATWPLTSPGVPSIRMLHNHFIVFDKQVLAAAPLADAHNPNLTDGGQHSLFQATMHDVYQAFFDALDLDILVPCPADVSRIALTGYPQGLPSWEVKGGAAALRCALLEGIRHHPQGLHRLLPDLLRPGIDAQFAAAARHSLPAAGRGKAAVRQ